MNLNGKGHSRGFLTVHLEEIRSGRDGDSSPGSEGINRASRSGAGDSTGGEITTENPVAVDVEDETLRGVDTEISDGEGGTSSGEVGGVTEVSGDGVDGREITSSVGGPAVIAEGLRSPGTGALSSSGVLPGISAGDGEGGGELELGSLVSIQSTGEDDDATSGLQLELGTIGPAILGTIDGDEGVHGGVQAVGVLSGGGGMAVTILSGDEGTSEVVALIDLNAFLLGRGHVGSDKDHRNLGRDACCLRQDYE